MGRRPCPPKADHLVAVPLRHPSKAPVLFHARDLCERATD